MGTLAALTVEIYLLIVLGGSVRIHHAGLACPDWPLCFGDIIPDYHPQVYLEFLHRAFAGLVSIVTAVLMFTLWRSKAPRGLKTMITSAAILVLVQALFGGLTVIHRLEAWVVTTHLGLGTGFFALVLWFYLRVKEPKPEGLTPALGRWSGFVLAAIFAQILLGGLVASHYAALVCTDFPTCHGQWFPTFRGIIGLHVIHRLGAYTLFTILLLNFIVMLRARAPKRAVKLAAWLFGVVCVQVCIGIANVILHTPPWIAILHLAVGTLLLMLATRQAHVANLFAIQKPVS